MKVVDSSSCELARGMPARGSEELPCVPVHVPTLAGLRGIAILLVLWEHTRGLSAWNDQAIQILLPGHFGVDMFFVLSGFLITRILLTAKKCGSPVTHFLIRRMLRIFPVYYLLLIVVAVVSYGPEVLWCAIYASNFYFALHGGESPLNHTWSLAIEEHFYLLWPFLVYGLSRRNGFIAAALIVPVSLLSALALVPYPELRVLILRASFCRASSLALGGLFAYFESDIRGIPWAIISFLGFCTTVTIGALALYFRPAGWGEFFLLIGGLPASAGAVLAAIVLNYVDCLPRRLLTCLPLTYIGAISYGLYLYHYPLFYWLGLTASTTSRPTLYAVAISLSFVAAILSYAFIEQPILSLKHRFR